MEIDKHITTDDIAVFGVGTTGASLPFWLTSVSVTLSIISQTLAISYLLIKHIKRDKKPDDDERKKK